MSLRLTLFDVARRPSAPANGYWPSNARMEAGRPLTRMSPRAGWSTCPSLTTTPSSIRLVHDLTGRVLELLGACGFDRQSLPVRRAVEMIRRTQEADGSWYGRWGVNYIYGTWQILRGLAAIGENMKQEWIRRGRDWLESCQNDDGGWGETCESYNFPALKGSRTEYCQPDCLGSDGTLRLRRWKSPLHSSRGRVSLAQPER